MVVNGEIHTVELTYAGQNISVTETSTSFYNERQKVQVSVSKENIIEPVSGHGKKIQIQNNSKT